MEVQFLSNSHKSHIWWFIKYEYGKRFWWNENIFKYGKKLKWCVSSRWLSSLYCPMRNSDELTVGKLVRIIRTRFIKFTFFYFVLRLYRPRCHVLNVRVLSSVHESAAIRRFEEEKLYYMHAKILCINDVIR